MIAIVFAILAVVMGWLKSDGRATQGGYTIPAGVFPFGELFRINGWNGIMLTAVASADTVRVSDLEISSERIWYFRIPAAVTANVGDYLYWTTGAGLKRGDTDLSATVAGSPIVKVEEAKFTGVDTNSYIAGRILNVGP